VSISQQQQQQQQPDDSNRLRVQHKIIELAAEQASVDPATITPQSRFVGDLEFDSLDAIDFTMKVEDALGVRIPEDQVEHLQTVEQVIEFVLQHPPAQGPPAEDPPEDQAPPR
jgi:acyl carrier protein